MLAVAGSGELTAGRKTLILATCCMSLFIVSMDVTVVNVALPSMRRDLDAPVSGMQWIMDAYTLVVASFLMLGGSTGDRLGRKRVFQVGLATFTTASVLCALAPSLGWLIGFRMLQAIGGSMLNPVAMSIIANTFTGRAERARAIGIWGGVVGVSQALGPLVGGALTDTTGWRSIFWVNVPVGLTAILLTALLVPNSKADRARRIDPIGQLLVILVLGPVTFGIIEGPNVGWGSVQTIGCFALAAVALVLLLLYEPRREDPLIEIGFFRSLPFSGATMIAVSGFAGMAAFLFLNVLYLQNERGLSPFEAGLYTMPMAAMTVLFGPLSGRWVGSRGPRTPLTLAGIAIALAGGLLSILEADTPSWQVIGTYLIFGVGFGLMNPPITNTAVSGMPRSRAGVAAATASTSRQIGVALGVAISGTLVVDSVAGEPVPTRAGWLLIIGAGVLVLILSRVTTGRYAMATAARTAERLGDADD